MPAPLQAFSAELRLQRYIAQGLEQLLAYLRRQDEFCAWLRARGRA